ncbi:MAG: lipopolysaccharide biosynthesis protein [Clostridia bacterium]|nr:lipopolysaccharide biosynthesis protein [Clostridia bacterium]
MIWMFMERVAAQLVSFIVSIILARLLLPSDYGVVSLVMVFITLCNVFVDGGFGNALVQKKDADDTDFSSVFYFSFFLSVVLYIGIFIFAPYLARFYKMPIITSVVRVMGLRLIIASFNSIQKAFVSRRLQFKKFFWSTIIGTVISAAVGIIMAYKGMGVWALVGQYLTNTVIDTIVLFITVRWYPKLAFSFSRMKKLVSYGWKVLVTALVDTFYEDFRSLYIGKLYTAQDLAYYTRGKQFPYLVINNINSSISSVLFPVMSKKQDSNIELRVLIRRSLKTGSYVIMPLMFGLAAIAKPLVLFLLTEKWLPCVPFLQILCFNAALMPIQTANIQAIYAMGRSDIVLRLNIIKKTLGFLIVLLSAQISVLAMAYGGIVTGLMCSIVNAFPNRRLINYSYIDQIKDILPSVLASAVMALGVLAVELLELSSIYTLIIQIIIGIVLYIVISVIFKIESFRYILDTLKSMLNKMKK